MYNDCPICGQNLRNEHKVAINTHLQTCREYYRNEYSGCFNAVLTGLVSQVPGATPQDYNIDRAHEITEQAIKKIIRCKYYNTK